MADQGSAGFLADTLARRLLEQSEDPVAVTGGDGRVHYANAGFCRLTGRAPDAVAGAPLAELVPGFDPLAEFQTVMLGDGHRGGLVGVSRRAVRDGRRGGGDRRQGA